ncbi:hypothetical protein BBJ28_00021899 [Nothophytophthora sp. Chile5]|nr:hypothetical protein BBJ28_00021899 [Nothophytophthora sp. Chile5]
MPGAVRSGRVAAIDLADEGEWAALTLAIENGHTEAVRVDQAMAFERFLHQATAAEMPVSCLASGVGLNGCIGEGHGLSSRAQCMRPLAFWGSQRLSDASQKSRSGYSLCHALHLSWHQHFNALFSRDRRPQDPLADFVLLDLAHTMEEQQVREKDGLPMLALPSPPSAAYTDYVKRRIDLWTDGEACAELLDTSTTLSLAQQLSFRRKLLLVFALQLLGVWLVVGLATFHPAVRDRATPVFTENSPVLLEVCAVATLVLLGVLYCVRNKCFVNLVVLLLFSGAQAATFTGLNVAFDTHIGFFNCGATFVWVLLVVLLMGKQLRDGVEADRHLLSPLTAGALAFVAVVVASCALFGVYGTRFVTGPAFGLSLLFQLALLTWFAYDAASMFEVMAAGEYAHGVIYLYTDMVLTVVFCLAVAGVAVGFTALMVLMVGGGGDCAFDCDCGDGLEACYVCFCGDSSRGNGRRSYAAHTRRTRRRAAAQPPPARTRAGQAAASGRPTAAAAEDDGRLHQRMDRV